MPLQDGLDHVKMATSEKTTERLADAKPGASWGQDEEYVIPENRLGIVIFGMMCALSMVVLDGVMVGTALATIVAHLGDANNYTWLSSAYMLGASVMGPLYGKWSDVLGRKTVFYCSIVTYLIASALCGAAQTMTWLIVCRAVQGLGGAGIIQLAIVVVSDIIPLNERGTYHGCLGATLGIFGIVGPVIGGALAQYVSWRWCFLITLPIGGVAVIVLFIFLSLNPHQSGPFRKHLAEFDWIGLTCIILGTVCLLIGLNFGQTSWSDAKAIVPAVAGCIILIAGGINEAYTQRSPIIPLRLFQTRTTAIILISGFFDGIVASGGGYYLSIYYQLLGASPTGAGLEMVPYKIGHAGASIISGIVISRTGVYRPTLWVAWICMIAGWGLMVMLNNKSSIALQATISLIVGFGGGCFAQVHFIAIQASMPFKDMATSTSAIGFINSLGGAISTPLCGAVISHVLPVQLAVIPNVDSLNIGTSPGSIIKAIHQISQIEDMMLRKEVMSAFSRTIRVIWVVLAAFSGLGFLCSLFVRGYSLERKIVRGGVAKAVCVETAVGTPVSEKEEDNFKGYSVTVEPV